MENKTEQDVREDALAEMGAMYGSLCMEHAKAIALIKRLQASNSALIEQLSTKESEDENNGKS